MKPTKQYNIYLYFFVIKVQLFGIFYVSTAHVDLDLLACEVSRSHSDTVHSVTLL